MSRVLRFLIAGALLTAAIAAQTPALRKGVSVKMPVTTNAAAAPDADLTDSLVVAVTRDGSAFLNVTRETPAQLSENVKARLAARPGRRVYVKGDARTPYSTVVTVLDALQSAGVNAPILLTSQQDSTRASYVPPMGLEVLLPPSPDAAQTVILKASDGQTSDAELKQLAGQGMLIILQADGTTPFGDVVHAVDLFRGDGARVFLAMRGE